MKILRSLVLTSLLVTIHCSAAAAIEPAIGAIVDTRTNGATRGSLRVELKVVGDEVPDVEAMRAVVISVFDDTGRDLNDVARQERQSQRFTETRSGSGIQLNFKNPSRKAVTVKELVGRADLFIPRNDPESTLLIENFLQKLNQPLESAVFKSNGVSIMFLDSAQYEAKVKQELRTVAAHPLTGLAPPAHILHVRVVDPEGRFVSIEFDNGEGQRLRPQSSAMANETYSFFFAAQLPSTARAKIRIATQKAVVRVPFQFENIILP